MTFDMRRISAGMLALLLSAGAAAAGPIIIDGTDANDHGFFSGGNQSGWFYMQRVLENLAGELGGGVQKTILNVGADTSTAGSAITSAFTNSTLPGLGWNMVGANGTGAGAGSINDALSSLSTSNTGILYIASAQNSSGDLSAAELAVVNGYATEIATFVNSGGALFAMSESDVVGGWGWLTTLIPTLVVNDVGGGGNGAALSLTPAGTAAFPSLTDGDISSGPWHNYFSGSFGSLQVLATDDSLGRAVILGGGAEATLEAVPEPASLVLFGTGLAAAARQYRKRRAA